MNTENTEIWKDVQDYVGYYQVSSLGRVRSVARTVVGSDNIRRDIQAKILRVDKGWVTLSRDGEHTRLNVRELWDSGATPSKPRKRYVPKYCPPDLRRLSIVERERLQSAPPPDAVLPPEARVTKLPRGSYSAGRHDVFGYRGW